MAKQDTLTRIKERFADASDFMRETHARMREDARFSNPADPQQWDDGAKQARAGRPMLVFDKTNQFIAQVVNDIRQNKPQIHCLPADSNADVVVAQKLNGIIKHIEYVSRAGIAYDTAAENAVRLGLGWLRVIPQVMRPETNEQEVRILRVHDPLSCLLDPNSTEPDGSDAMFAFSETTYTKQAFSRAYPKAKVASFDEGLWFGQDSVRVCEYFEVVTATENRLICEFQGTQFTVTEDEYWEAVQATGVRPNVISTFQSEKRSVRWAKVSGLEVLEQTDFPSQYLPVIPVLGHEMWVEGKRFLCGMVRRMADAQRFHNYAISAAAESVALQPKSPFIAAAESIDGYEDEWARANVSNASYLPYNAQDPETGAQLPMPSRSAPPVLGQGWAELLGYSASAMEASVGMYAANLGKQGNETSGRAIRARQAEGDTATFHFTDNLSRSIEQLGRVIVDMIPRIYDTPRQARIVGEDGEQDFVRVDPNMQQPTQKQGRKVVAINPAIGAYDVRVKAGPSYTSLRQESADQLGNLLQAAPNLMPIIGDEWVRSQDWPGADKIARRLKAMLPPNLQAIEDEDQEIPPEAVQQIEALKAEIQKLSQALENAAAEAESKKIEKDKAEADILIRGYQAITDRMKAVPPITPEQVQAIAMQTVQQALAVPPIEPDDMGEMRQEAMQPEMPQQMQPMPQQMPQMAAPNEFEPPMIDGEME